MHLFICSLEIREWEPENVYQTLGSVDTAKGQQLYHTMLALRIALRAMQA